MRARSSTAGVSLSCRRIERTIMVTTSLLVGFVISTIPHSLASVFAVLHPTVVKKPNENMSSSSSSSSSRHQKEVTPGEILGSSNDFDCCGGCYVEAETQHIRASLVGRVVISNDEIGSSTKKKITVTTTKTQVASEAVIAVSDTVTCRVVRITMNQANVEILAVGDRPLQEFAKGVIRREDIRLSEVDKVIMHECFMPGDIVRAQVSSLGDSRQYFLSTAEVDFGVILAKAQTTGNLMTALSWKEMEDPITKEKELRKVAKP